MSSTTLVVPDCHVSPGQDLSRFDALGQLIIDRRPDRIVFGGDFLTLASLSNWDQGKPGVMENKRYAQDMQVGIDALDLALTPLLQLQEKQRANKERMYRPRIVYIIGNHSHRIERYLQYNPQLKGHMSVEKDLCLMDFGFTDIVPYKEYIEFDGVLFTHAPVHTGGAHVSGKYAIHRAADMITKSLVFFHTHRKESMNVFRFGSTDVIQVLTAGCFFTEVEEYAQGQPNNYWSGLILLNHWDTVNGRFDAEEISLERLQKMYV